MINNFNTVFEAREDRLQIENAFHGECIDFVAKVTTDGVLDSLQYYTAKGLYQAMDTLSADVWYPIRTDISGDCVVLHWTPSNDLGSDSYRIYCLMEKPGETAYPLVWRLNLAYSPGYPAHAVDPIPQQIDFSRYDLLNAPWIEATETDTAWIVDKVVQVPGLDLSSLSAQDIVIAGGSLFDAISGMDERIDGISGDIARGLSAVEALSTHSDSISAHLNASVEEVASTASRIESKVDAITIPTDYAKESTLTDVANEIQSEQYGLQRIESEASILEDEHCGLESIKQDTENLTNESYGLESIKHDVDGLADGTHPVNSHLAEIGYAVDVVACAVSGVQSSVNGVQSSLNSSTYGLSAIKTAVESIVIPAVPTDYAKEASLSVVAANVLSTYYKASSAEQGVWMVKSLVDNKSDIHANVLSAANKAADNNALLMNNDNGLGAIKDAIQTANEYLSDDTYGLPSIQYIVDNIQNYVYEIPGIYSGVDYIAYNLVGGIPSVKEQIADGNAGLSALLGDCAAALDVINGEVL